MTTERRNYAEGTYVTQTFPFGFYSLPARALCADGKVRALSRVAQTADTFFSVPASVRAHGRTVAGYITVECLSGSSVATEDDPAVVRFVAYTYRKNHDAIGTSPAPMTRAEGIAYLTQCADRQGKHWSGGLEYRADECPTCRGTNRAGHLAAPCSRYGRDADECAPVAWRLAYLIARESGEPVDLDALDAAMSLVVNDSDEVAYIVREYGRRTYR